MKRFLTFILVVLGVLILTPSVAQAVVLPGQDRKIVVFQEGVSEEDQQTILNQHRATFEKRLRLVNARAVRISSFDAQLLTHDPRVLRIDPDVQVFALPRQSLCDRYPWLPWCSQPSPTPTPTPNPSPSTTPSPTAIPSPTPTVTPEPTITPSPSPNSQPIPWGVAKIKADQAWVYSRGNGVKVAVLDTGIDRDHPDLRNNLAGCFNFISSWRTCEDDNGHGTHVSGIIAAEDNSFGVVGVAPEAKIYSLKVLDRQGSGYLSDIIEGLDWAVQNQMAVVNMSLGTTSDIQSFQEAIQQAHAAGIVLVAAAGNSGGAVNFPAAYPEVIAVSALDQNNLIASWSSRGPEVDLSAPGVSIYSTYRSGGYKTLSGTSMASPHLAGAAAVLLTQTSKCDLNSDGTCSPAEVQQRLQLTAEDLGVSGPDSFYGFGLVNLLKTISE